MRVVDRGQRGPVPVTGRVARTRPPLLVPSIHLLSRSKDEASLRHVADVPDGLADVPIRAMRLAALDRGAPPHKPAVHLAVGPAVQIGPAQVDNVQVEHVGDALGVDARPHGVVPLRVPPPAVAVPPRVVHAPDGQDAHPHGHKPWRQVAAPPGVLVHTGHEPNGAAPVLGPHAPTDGQRPGPQAELTSQRSFRAVAFTVARRRPRVLVVRLRTVMGGVPTGRHPIGVPTLGLAAPLDCTYTHLPVTAGNGRSGSTASRPSSRTLSRSRTGPDSC